MYEHDGSHDECDDVYEIGCALEDDGVGDLDAAGVAIGHDAGGGGDG